ncbi:MAG: glycosyltransferase family 2 protein [Candidatus Hodarchaeota archaeon]
MKTTYISVIIPAFNSEKYISAAIDSVLAQTFQVPEIIVVDDGSIDNTREICLHYRQSVKYIYQQNAGPGAARNKGMSLSAGKYISFLDSDDIMLPYKLELQKACMDKADPSVAFIMTDFSMIKQDRIIHKSCSRRFFNIFLENKDLSYDNIFTARKRVRDLALPCPEEYTDKYFYFGNISRYLIMGNLVLPSSTMFRRECLENFNTHYFNYEDYELVSRLSKKHDIGYLDIPTVLYRIHDYTLTSDINLERRLKTYFHIVDTVWHRDPMYYRKFRDEIDRALASKAYSLGRYYLSTKRFNEASFYFRESLRNRKLQKGCYVYLLWSYLRNKLASKE